MLPDSESAFLGICRNNATHGIMGIPHILSVHSCPPRSFIPALCKIFLDEEAPDNVLEVTARALTYYLDVSVECSRRITTVDGALKAIIARMYAADMETRMSKDLVEQSVKVPNIASYTRLPLGFLSLATCLQRVGNRMKGDGIWMGSHTAEHVGFAKIYILSIHVVTTAS